MASPWRAARSVLRRLGVDVHRHPHVATRNGHLGQLLDRFGVDLVLDVGANRGQFARSLRTDVGFDGRIVSFEPDPATFDELTLNARADRSWECRRVALGAHEGIADLHRFTDDDWNSLREPDHVHLEQSGRSLSEVDVAEVDVCRLDTLWSTLDLDGARPFLKVDTQGSDLEVMAGVSEHLGSLAAVLVEASVFRFYEDEPDLREMLAWFDARGWKPSGFFPVVREQTTMALQQLDVTFVPPA